MLASNVSHTQRRPDPLLQAFFASNPIGASAAVHDAASPCPPSLPQLLVAEACIDDEADRPEWSEEDVVLLHWRLLLELRRLPDPETPLEDKLDTLAWALTDPDRDSRPFSFANCLRVVGTSPMSPTPYFGLIEVEEIRGWLRANARHWIRASIARYPDWVRDLIRSQPDWVASQLSKNPQWINEQVKARLSTAQASLFGVECAQLAS